jgi:hypothetical protein
VRYGTRELSLTGYRRFCRLVIGARQLCASEGAHGITVSMRQTAAEPINSQRPSLKAYEPRACARARRRSSARSDNVDGADEAKLATPLRAASDICVAELAQRDSGASTSPASVRPLPTFNAER